MKRAVPEMPAILLERHAAWWCHMSYYSTVTWVFLYPGWLCVCQGLRTQDGCSAKQLCSRNPLHQHTWNSHICDVFELTQAHLFFLLPPSTTAPSALPLLPIPQLCGTSSSRRTRCTNTHSALHFLKITSQAEKRFLFAWEWLPSWLPTMW